MAYISYTISPTNGKVVRQGLERLRRKLPLVGRQRLYETARLIVADLSPDNVPLPTYPINWDSVKQKYAFFHTDGFGGGIPHVRTGKRTKWTIVSLKTGYGIRNRNRRSVYVYGDALGEGQSQIHVGRWPLFKVAVDKRVAKLPKKIRDALVLSTQKEGFNAK